ncbi:restriction endonuclease subunit S [Plasticicumulans acidivorans]|uniref:Type I restriction enzyme S subunit n=1 Tax=Plasticicumulans acidivorans TaxID=886464 RepID=A0A317MZR5_9GAMM|nr:restriction endonuclease subunit S [Plasticicumulans acidivorans]PWV61242.1 type I restriction enzyme S subunit [Plasticicumulans acidivorans]
MSSKGTDAMRKDNSNKSALVPRRRFPEFQDASEWESKPLKTMGAFFRGLTYSADEVAEEGLLVLRSSNIQDGTLVLDKDLVFVDKPCPDDIQLRSGDIAICMSNGSKALVGKSAEFRGDYDGHLTVGAFCSIFRPSVEFAKLIFQTPKYAKFVSVAIGGGNINNLKNSDLEELDHPVPRLQPEQQKIADCLSSLDELITAETQKLDALKTHKKGLMQQLFPREGETVPRLRFPEFREAGEWDEKRLGEVGNVRMCKRILKEQTSPRGDIPFYKIGTFGGVPDAYISREIFENFRNSYPFPKNGAVLISAAGTIGRTVRYNGELAYFQDSNIVWLESDEDLIADGFLLYIYQLINWAPSVGAIQRLYNENILGAQVKFPSIPEQQKIADCLSSLDELITAETQKLDALKTHKKGLMQQLFPVPDEVPA